MNTTDQARLLWCPMVRMSTIAPVLVFQPGGKVTRSDVVSSFGGSANTGGENHRRNEAAYRPHPDTRCVASKCAMWRWTDRAHESRKPTAWWPKDDDAVVEPPRPADLPIDAEWIPTTGEGEDITGGYWLEPQSAVDAEVAVYNAVRRGYCGLAGRLEVMP